MPYEHPADRIGDFSVASDARTAFGEARAKHDLSLVETGPCSHGGRHEQIVVRHPQSYRYAALLHARIRNQDLHDLVLNGAARSVGHASPDQFPRRVDGACQPGRGDGG